MNDDPNPVLVEVTRGGHIECRHRGAALVISADGTIIGSWGDTQRALFPRSAIKPLQAIPLVESGAAQAFEVSERELALACASHSGEAAHVEAVAAWLQRIGLDVTDLECGDQWPMRDEAARALVADRRKSDGTAQQLLRKAHWVSHHRPAYGRGYQELCWKRSRRAATHCRRTQ